ncbi:hypothetical protein YH65_09240 [Sulfurovum lithotrophicum]|uniref:Branched-chain amino acid aminotransferase n=1 Tax=Sulfurovum lithotrophicum TaxID=206403 RepID=A0A7U4M283_9BACT|nr:aminotransferase class IV family protein [Sulfurovum lithotrophicum]AKF25539.1 hypothetical protein YH65_09240 [Sulfurovum lithotrophicum]
MQTASPLLLETIKTEDGTVFNLPYHQARFDHSRKALFNTDDTLDLSKIIDTPPKGLYRCRILYDTNIRSVDYIPYIPKKIHTLRVIPSDIEYIYKYADREAFNILLRKNSDVDEIIIEKEGLLTDTTISNIAFYDGKKWLTPAKPLLQGTMRAKLISEGFLREADISKEMLGRFTHVALINAMLGFKILNHLEIQH